MENTQLPDACIDVILCSGMLHHLDLSYALPELRRILAPGGRILAVEALDYRPAPRQVQGAEVALLERSLADFVGAAECVDVANGTEALLIAMMALGVGQGEGDEVIMPGFSYIATAEAAALLGARPV